MGQKSHWKHSCCFLWPYCPGTYTGLAAARLVSSACYCPFALTLVVGIKMGRCLIGVYYLIPVHLVCYETHMSCRV